MSTGVDGLDTVLCGGLLEARNYLVRGGPGTGKTTLALHFLTRGAPEGDPTLYVSLSCPGEEVRTDAAAVNLKMADVAVLDLSAPTGLPTDSDIEIENHLLNVDQERTPIVRAILGWARELQPRRIVIDSVTRLRELIHDIHAFRREVLALLRALNGIGATVLATSESTPDSPDHELQFLADGVISLGMGDQSRHVEVSKLRGSTFKSGHHTVRLTDDGMVVFPRLQPADHSQEFSEDCLSFGVPSIDELLHGGLERGTVALISGPSGVGKTTLGAQFMKEAAGRGERSVLFMFEEAPATFLHRCESVSIPVHDMIDRGTLSVVPVEPWSHTPDEITSMVRTEVEDHDASAVMLDSVASYQLSITDGTDGTDGRLTRLHTLGRYLKNMGVTGLFIDEVPTVTGNFVVSEHGLSYLADTVIFLRHLEVQGELGKIIGVLKKRTSDYENALRELQITPHGIKVGEPLGHLRGVLSGIPEIVPTET